MVLIEKTEHIHAFKFLKLYFKKEKSKIKKLFYFRLNDLSFLFYEWKIVKTVNPRAVLVVVAYFVTIVTSGQE